MILVDTSVVVDHLRGKDPKLAVLLPALPVAVCGVVRAEVLCGSRNPADRQKLLTTLAAFQLLPIPDALWDVVGDNLAALRRGGLTIPFPDAIVVSVAMANGIELWARDQHFPLIQRLLPALKLFQEPP